jgi:hypothetical protein
MWKREQRNHFLKTKMPEIPEKCSGMTIGNVTEKGRLSKAAPFFAV